MGAFFVCAYTSESAETDKYVYMTVNDNGTDFLLRIDKSTDEISMTAFAPESLKELRLAWVEFDQINLTQEMIQKQKD